ncbi:copper-binding protein, partial [Lactobacillus crispatus]
KFTMDPDKVKAVDVKAAIEKMGYEVQGIKEKELN